MKLYSNNNRKYILKQEPLAFIPVSLEMSTEIIKYVMFVAVYSITGNEPSLLSGQRRTDS